MPKKELDYLKKLRYSDKLLGWDKNYDSEGNWKENVIIHFGDVDKQFDVIYKKGGLHKANKTDLMNICKKLNIFFKNKGISDLRNELQESYQLFMDRKNVEI